MPAAPRRGRAPQARRLGDRRAPARARRDARSTRSRRWPSASRRTPTPRVQLGNLYFDAERYDDAIKWYGDALKLSPKDVDVSTDLGVSYYYTNQPDKALEQFDQSLQARSEARQDAAERRHRARRSASRISTAPQEAWQQVIQLAPDSPEGQAAKRALDSLQSAHPPARRRGAAGRNRVRDVPRSSCFMLLVFFVSRAVWRLFDGIVEGASAPAAALERRAPQHGRADGARSGLRHVRRARPRGHARRRPRPRSTSALTDCRDKYRARAPA